MYCTYFVVLIDAGSRYEVDYPSGLSHVIEKMAFKVSHIFVSYILSIMLLNQSFYTFCDSDPDQASNYQ